MPSLKGYSMNSFLVNFKTPETKRSVSVKEDWGSSKVGFGRFDLVFIS